MNPNTASFFRTLALPTIARALFVITTGLFVAGAAAQQRHTPPREPHVKPQIARSYPEDPTGRRITDGLFNRMNGANAEELNALVDVELIFTEQVTQQQIDQFAAMGGEITYLFQSVSYGWNGRIPLRLVRGLPQAMGASLVLVKEPLAVKANLYSATQTGRARTLWTNFAGNASGFDGNTNITIAIVDSGVDATHTDLAGRQKYFKDWSGTGYTNGTDYYGHGTHVAGIALGTGASGGSASGPVNFTQFGDLSSAAVNGYIPFYVSLPNATTWRAGARWTNGTSAALSLYDRSYFLGSYQHLSLASSLGNSPLSLSSTINSPSASSVYSSVLTKSNTVTSFVTTNYLSSYPASSDSFNRFRGVAPGCNWASAKVFDNSGNSISSWASSAVDDLVTYRTNYNIKVMNLSIGIDGSPGTDTSLRQKVNTAVLNGIIVVAAAGNDGGSSQIDDPGRAAYALTVGAVNGSNYLATYSSVGFTSPGSTANQEEDYKPDILAPGGSDYTGYILAPDSNNGDSTAFTDQKANDYAAYKGTSMATPFVSGAAALVIDAMQQNGYTWSFTNAAHPKLVKMILCATATELNVNRENGNNNPTLQRADSDGSGFPASKDRYEGYGMMNPDAAIEGLVQSLTLGSTATNTFEGTFTGRRAWARRVSITANTPLSILLTVPTGGDFDMYLYSTNPATYGTPTILASSTTAGTNSDESITYNSTSNFTAMLVVKRVSGSGAFSLIASNVSNNNFVDGYTLSGDVGSRTGNNSGFTSESGEPTLGRSGSTAWYRWTAPHSGTVFFNASGASEIGFYTGSSVAALTAVPGNLSDSPSNSYSVTAGTTYRLQVDDAAGATGAFTVFWNYTDITSGYFSNSTAITSAASGTGSASPYPSTITLSNIVRSVTKATVTLYGATHSWPDDWDILLVGPTGEQIMLMSDSGTNLSFTNLTLTFDDSAANQVPDASQISSGTYRCGDHIGSALSMPSPAPAWPYSTNLSDILSNSPNGTWSLYVNDDSGTSYSGTISNGWSLNLTFNVAPAVSINTTALAYMEGGAATNITSTATVTDTDNTNFNGGGLTVQFTANGSTDDRLAISHQGTGAGQVGVSGTNISYGGINIGNYSGGAGTNALLINFTSTSATAAAAQQLITRITFQNVSITPSTATRTVAFTLNDGFDSTTVSKNITVTGANDAPLLTLNPTSGTFTEHGAFILIASNSIVSDVDSADFNGGSLVVMNTNGVVDGGDKLQISAQGTGAGQIGLSGANVTYGGVTIGTYSGGTGGSTPLTISFNSASATPAAAQALIRRIAYTNNVLNPAPGTRFIKFILADGDDGSTSATNSIAFVTVNDAPTISFINALSNAVEDTAFVISNVTITANSDMFDAENGYYGFRIVSITNGTLKLNGTNTVTLGNTTFWPPDFVTWTPPTNAFGTNINAFVVEGYDGALASTNTVTVRVAVTAVNDVPTLTTVSTLTGATQDTAFVISYSTLANAANEADVESAVSFRVESVTSGTLRKNSTNVVVGSTLLSTNESWSWLPATNVWGTNIAAFTVRAWDGTTTSANAVTVYVAVSQLNHAPVVANAISDQGAVYGQLYSYQHSTNVFTDSDTNQSLSYSVSGLPPGIMYFSGLRQFSGPAQASGNYTVEFVATDNGSPALSATNTFTFNIGKAQLTATASNAARTYGTTNPIFGGTLNGVVNGDNITASYSCSATTNSVAGDYSITTSLNDPGNKLTNYLTTLQNGTLTVSKAALLVTANNTNRNYGATNPEFTANYTGFVNGETPATSGMTGVPELTCAATTNSTTGGYVISNAIGSLASSNYSFTLSNATLTVAPVSLTVTPDNFSRAYGQTNPTLTGTISGLLNNDDVTANYSTTATTNSPAGTYPITAMLNDPDTKLGNYLVTTNSGTLTITNVILPSNYVATLCLTNSLVQLGLNGTTNVTFTDSVGREIVVALTMTAYSSSNATPSFTALDHFGPNGSPVHMGVESGLGGGDGNHVNRWEGANFTATLVSASSGIASNSIRFGIAGLGIRPDGPILSWISSATTTSTQAVSERLFTMDNRMAPIEGTNYSAQLRTSNDAQYQFSDTVEGASHGLVLCATFFVGERMPLIVTANNATRGTGSTNPTFTVTYSGFTGGDTLEASDVSGAPLLTCDATAASPAGTYVISNALGTLVSSKYLFTLVNGTLMVTNTITPPVLSVSITSPTNGATVLAGDTHSVFTAFTGDVTKVEFFEGSTLFATVTNAPFTAAWTNPYAGTFQLIAKASDSLGGTASTTNLVTSQVNFRNPVMDGTNLTVTLFGKRNETYVISTSTNLNDWTFLRPNIDIINGGATVTVTNATDVKRFFRAELD